MVGTTVGQYRITRRIGAGGMGVVYLAEHTLLGRAAAVKMLLPELSQDRVVVSRFFNEARAATSIRHPGIVEIYDFGFGADGAAYIVMEHLEGETLTRRAKKKQITYDSALAIVRQIASALAAAHAKGIVHRDLKPDNVFLVPDPDIYGGERIKLLDFGIAKLADAPPRRPDSEKAEEGESESGSGHLTRTGAVMGTPAYMAPEQCRGISAGGSITDTKITSNEVYAVSGSATQQGRAIAGGLRLTTSVMGQRTVSILRSTIAGNSATSEDGAARAGGMEASVSAPLQGQSWILEVQMLASTVSDNRVQAPVMAQVGGVNVAASAAGAASIFSLTNSTISGNKVDGLTGIATTGGLEVSTDKETASANLSLFSSTITNNSVTGATAGAGGINLIVGIGSATTGVSSRNTIVAGNLANANTDCRTNGPVIASTGYNLYGIPTNCTFSGTTTGNLTGAAGLAPLADNGGPTRTHAFMSGSQAINAGNPSGCLDRQSAALTTDQRGQPRVAGGRCDIGAFEQQ